MTQTTPLAVPSQHQDTINREWHRLSRPGAFFTAAQRVALATEARRERVGDATRTIGISAAAADAARKVSTEAMRIRAEWVSDLESRGLNRLAYLEIVALVSRLEAVDVFEFGVGRQLRALPEPADGSPTGQIDPSATMRGAWVPTTGPPNAGIAFSAIPEDHLAMHDIHETFFIRADQIGDFDLIKDLIRPQMEIVAARTSMLNECFY